MVLKKSLKNGFKINEKHDDDHKDYNIVPKHEEKEDQVETASEENEEEAPDGGWGWMVTFALIVVLVTSIGPNASFTIVFGDFLEATNQAGSVTTMINSLFNISYSISGLVTSSLLKQFSMRSIGIIGAILFSVPNVMMAFVHHVMEMAVISFLQGIGLGLIYTICNINFNAYFVKKRSMVMGIAQAIVGIGGIIYPIAIEKMMEAYGFRGTAAITGALSLNCIMAMALMRPTATWKAKFLNKEPSQKKKKIDEIKEPLMSRNSLPLSREIRLLQKSEKWNSCRSLQEERPEVRVASVTDAEAGAYRERSKSVLLTGWPEWSKKRKGSLLANITSSSLTNLRVQPGTETLNNAVLKLRVPQTPIAEDEPDNDGEIEGDVVVNQKTPGLFGKRSRRVLDSLIDFSLLKDRSFMNMCLGLSFVYTSDFTFMAFLPLMMTSRGYSKADAAVAITASASAELVSRIGLAAFTIFIDARPKMILFVAMICMTLAKVGYLYLEETLLGTLSMVVAVGVVRSWLLVPQPLVVVENLGVEQFAAAYGVFAVVNGVISVVFGPLAGLIKDWTDSFVVCQIVLLVMNVVFIIPWAIELLFSSKKSILQSG
ncbi:hypothetical protein QAD02_009355 [Eretmocerus hayati]|uniref:Uncharacterized protein n=1 Tax=Eretmocerus hayati TaxID=131215 RepID=A0ACC2NBG3_9HYME|nr:hypothetical protein QAD02_009355 [Eretmocerus hayati]